MAPLEEIWRDRYPVDSYEGPIGTVRGRAILVPEPPGDHDCQAVAVYVGRRHVGYLPHLVAPRVKAALTTVARLHGDRPVGCKAELRKYRSRPDVIQVILLLDLQKLGLRYADIETQPSLARALESALDRLKTDSPAMSGYAPNLSDRLATSIALAEHADRTRDPDTRFAADRELRDLAAELEAASDPRAAQAWHASARMTRYLRGRRDDTLAAFVAAIYFDRDNDDAWCELIEYSGLAPHVPTYLALFSHVPPTARGRPLRWILSIARGSDQYGRMAEAGGRELRRGLLELAEREDDLHTLIEVLVENALKAEDDNDSATATACWRRAAHASSSRPELAESFSKRLMDYKRYAEAVEVLTLFESSADVAPDLQRKLIRRLNHCRRQCANAEAQQ
jgi:hypothetical protein